MEIIQVIIAFYNSFSFYVQQLKIVFMKKNSSVLCKPLNLLMSSTIIYIIGSY